MIVIKWDCPSNTVSLTLFTESIVRRVDASLERNAKENIKD